MNRTYELNKSQVIGLSNFLGNAQFVCENGTVLEVSGGGYEFHESNESGIVGNLDIRNLEDDMQQFGEKKWDLIGDYTDFLELIGCKPDGVVGGEA